MEVEELLKDAREADKEAKGEDDRKKKGPIWYIAGIIIAMMIIMMIVPYYGIKADPQPEKIVKLGDVLPDNFSYQKEEKVYGNDKEDYIKLKRPEEVKIIADRVAAKGCSSYSRVCYAKAIFYFVKDNFEYINDPLYIEYIKPAPESLLSQGGDCDDASVLLSNLLEAVGIKTRYVFVPGHVYVQASLPEALKKYKIDGDWVSMDATCMPCEFGDVHYSYIDEDKDYL